MTSEPKSAVLALDYFVDELAKSVRDQVATRLNPGQYPDCMMQPENYPYIGAYYSHRLGTEFIFEVHSATSLKLDISSYGTWVNCNGGGFVHQFQSALLHYLPNCEARLGDTVWLPAKVAHSPSLTCTLTLTLKKDIRPVESRTRKSLRSVQEPDPGDFANAFLGNSAAFI